VIVLIQILEKEEEISFANKAPTKQYRQTDSTLKGRRKREVEKLYQLIYHYKVFIRLLFGRSMCRTLRAACSSGGTMGLQSWETREDWG
jgi:hypothetical protein